MEKERHNKEQSQEEETRKGTCSPCSSRRSYVLKKLINQQPLDHQQADLLRKEIEKTSQHLLENIKIIQNRMKTRGPANKTEQANDKCGNTKEIVPYKPSLPSISTENNNDKCLKYLEYVQLKKSEVLLKEPIVEQREVKNPVSVHPSIPSISETNIHIYTKNNDHSYNKEKIKVQPNNLLKKVESQNKIKRQENHREYIPSNAVQTKVSKSNTKIIEKLDIKSETTADSIENLSTTSFYFSQNSDSLEKEGIRRKQWTHSTVSKFPDLVGDSPTVNKKKDLAQRYNEHSSYYEVKDNQIKKKKLPASHCNKQCNCLDITDRQDLKKSSEIFCRYNHEFKCFEFNSSQNPYKNISCPSTVAGLEANLAWVRTNTYHPAFMRGKGKYVVSNGHSSLEPQVGGRGDSRQTFCRCHMSNMSLYEHLEQERDMSSNETYDVDTSRVDTRRVTEEKTTWCSRIIRRILGVCRRK